MKVNGDLQRLLERNAQPDSPRPRKRARLMRAPSPTESSPGPSTAAFSTGPLAGPSCVAGEADRHSSPC
jgi:hypothetical protein